ncbi:hypothetical protein ABMY20_15265 [Tenacibaculum sp. SSH1-16]|uniref:hypothetical protein n=1 Tax=Tenacibaculum sp. SSH1-16 TaxID=3136667 RepID=UPI0032C3ED4C|nr:hypothetical protein BACY1_20750 [Tenacibaculum mesophilum]
MSQQIITTKVKIAKAFKKWNKQFLQTPSEFEDIDTSEDYATRQAEFLIKNLES